MGVNGKAACTGTNLEMRKSGKSLGPFGGAKFEKWAAGPKEGVLLEKYSLACLFLC